jgi:hypothetical protein
MYIIRVVCDSVSVVVNEVDDRVGVDSISIPGKFQKVLPNPKYYRVQVRDV